ADYFMLAHTRVKPPVSCIMLARIMTRRRGFWLSSYLASTSAPAGLVSAATYFSQYSALSALLGFRAMLARSSRVTATGVPGCIDGVAAARALANPGEAASSDVGGGVGKPSFAFFPSHAGAESEHSLPDLTDTRKVVC